MLKKYSIIFIYLFYSTSFAESKNETKIKITNDIFHELFSMLKESILKNKNNLCHGNFITGYHIPRGHEKWFWVLNMKTGFAKIEKSSVSVTGNVDMFCYENKWVATLTNMKHGVEYNCKATIDNKSLINGVCLTNIGGIIDITGDFSTRE